MTVSPNFFIIGAPRCGTTAMSTYLGEHPDVCFANPKEPLFFCEDMPGLRFATTEAEYQACFQHSQGESAVGEGSVWYLASNTAIEKILGRFTDARFIIMVRNPIELVTSLHQKLLLFRDEDQSEFESAWALQAERKDGRRLPKGCREPQQLQYADIGKIGRQVQRAYELIPANQRLVIVYDDFKYDPRSCYLSVLAFLGLQDDGRRSFPQVNENQAVRNRHLWNAAHHISPALINGATRLKRLLGIDRLGLLPRMRESLTVSKERAPLTNDLRSTLADVFKDDIALLSEVLERDLTAWSEAERG